MNTLMKNFTAMKITLLDALIILMIIGIITSLVMFARQELHSAQQTGQSAAPLALSDSGPIIVTPEDHLYLYEASVLDNACAVYHPIPATSEIHDWAVGARSNMLAVYVSREGTIIHQPVYIPTNTVRDAEAHRIVETTPGINRLPPAY